MPRNPEVDTFIAELGHPLEKEIRAVRRIVLGVDRRITETIKWKSPTFVFEGNIASIEPRSKKQVSLLFHQGAKLPGTHPALEGGGGDGPLPPVRGRGRREEEAEGPGEGHPGLVRAQGGLSPGPIPFGT